LGHTLRTVAERAPIISARDGKFSSRSNGQNSILPCMAAAVTAVYDRNEYLPDKRLALEAWAAAHVFSLASGGRASEIAEAA
jgi:hypothetical protein